MNPDTNRFEPLTEQPQEPQKNQETTRRQMQEIQRQLKKADADLLQAAGQLIRPDGSPVPRTWSVFQVGETVVIKDYTFRVAYIGETSILFEPVGPVVLDDVKGTK